MKKLIKKILRESELQNKKSNFEQVLEKFENSFPSEFRNRIPIIEKFVRDYIEKSKYNIKFLNACQSFLGVRTKDQIIICSPNHMATLGDFIYTLFHEIRHEQQISEIKMENPLSDFDLEDFEKIHRQYWEMELDADQFAKNMVAKIVHSLKLQIDVIKEHFKLSDYIKNYPQSSDFVKKNLENIINTIKKMKKEGLEYSDIQDHPIVKPYIKNLENFL